MYYKPTEFNQNRLGHFLIKILIQVFLMWTTLNFRGRRKAKEKGSRYLHEDPRHRIWTRSGDWFRLYVRRLSHRQTHTHRHTHTFFLELIFRMSEWYRFENHKKSKSNFLTIAILPSLLMSLENKNHKIVTINMEIFDINIENVYIRWSYRW